LQNARTRSAAAKKESQERTASANKESEERAATAAAQRETLEVAERGAEAEAVAEANAAVDAKKREEAAKEAQERAAAEASERARKAKEHLDRAISLLRKGQLKAAMDEGDEADALGADTSKFKQDAAAAQWRASGKGFLPEGVVFRDSPENGLLGADVLESHDASRSVRRSVARRNIDGPEDRVQPWRHRAR
jgi:hypothetical protein